jgi:hypothetical protein
LKGLYGLVGMKFRPQEARDHLAALPNGAPLVLKREPGNQHDRYAVQVWSGDVHIGYVKGSQVQPLAMAMDAALEPARDAWPAKLAIDGGKWPLVEVEE